MMNHFDILNLVDDLPRSWPVLLGTFLDQPQGQPLSLLLQNFVQGFFGLLSCQPIPVAIGTHLSGFHSYGHGYQLQLVLNGIRLYIYIYTYIYIYKVKPLDTTELSRIQIDISKL